MPKLKFPQVTISESLLVRKRLDNQTGQSTIEFLLTLSLLMAFILLYVQLSMVFAFGNYAQYATFMAARAFLSAGVNQQDQQERATNVINASLKKGSRDRLAKIAKGEGGTEPTGTEFFQHDRNAAERTTAWLQGIRYTFKSRVFLLPLGRSQKPGEITLKSESYLGREPTYNECQVLMDQNGWSYDNGC